MRFRARRLGLEANSLSLIIQCLAFGGRIDCAKMYAMTLKKSDLTPYHSRLLHDHKLRQKRLAHAAYRLVSTKKNRTSILEHPPRWSLGPIHFDAHVRAHQLHVANRRVRAEVKYIKRRCIELEVCYGDVVGRCSSKRVVAARRLLIWEVRQEFALGYGEIGRAFGGRDKATIAGAIGTFDCAVSHST